MEIYTARLGLVTNDKIDEPTLYVREIDISHWLQNRGFEITNYFQRDYKTYEYIEKSFARYGKFSDIDVIADLNIKSKEKGLKLTLDLASNSYEMISEIFIGLKEGKPRLKVDTALALHKSCEARGDFDRFEYGNCVRKISSVSDLMKFLK